MIEQKNDLDEKEEDDYADELFEKELAKGDNEDDESGFEDFDEVDDEDGDSTLKHYILFCSG